MALPKFDPEGGPAEPPVTDLNEAVRRARRGERVVVRGEDDDVAVVISFADLRRLQEDDRRRAEAIGELKSIAERFRDLDPDETDREAQAAVDAIRAEWRGTLSAADS